jgi:hypothetical protein
MQPYHSVLLIGARITDVQTGVRDTNTHEILGGLRSVGPLAAEQTQGAP